MSLHDLRRNARQGRRTRRLTTDTDMAPSGAGRAPSWQRSLSRRTYIAPLASVPTLSYVRVRRPSCREPGTGCPRMPGTTRSSASSAAGPRAAWCGSRREMEPALVYGLGTWRLFAMRVLASSVSGGDVLKWIRERGEFRRSYDRALFDPSLFAKKTDRVVVFPVTLHAF